MVFSRSFIVLTVIFRSIIHFELIYLYGLRYVQLHSFSCGYPIVSAPFIGEKNLFIPYWIVLELLSKKSGDHKCEGLSLDNWFCSTDLYVYPYAVCLDSCSFVVGFEFGKVCIFQLFSSFSKMFSYSGLHFYMNYRISLSISAK